MWDVIHNGFLMSDFHFLRASLVLNHGLRWRQTISDISVVKHMQRDTSMEQVHHASSQLSAKRKWQRRLNKVRPLLPKQACQTKTNKSTGGTPDPTLPQVVPPVDIREYCYTLCNLPDCPIQKWAPNPFIILRSVIKGVSDPLQVEGISQGCYPGFKSGYIPYLPKQENRFLGTKESIGQGRMLHSLQYFCLSSLLNITTPDPQSYVF